jgi:hypothetical protein
MDSPATHNRRRSWYSDTIAGFVNTDPDRILGQLSRNSLFAVETTQRNAWLEEIDILRAELQGLTGTLFLEFVVPRIGSRIDAVLLIDPVVFVLEFKVGERHFQNAAIDQVWDYALDLKNFHEASHDPVIAPILIATHARSVDRPIRLDHDGIFRPIKVVPSELRGAIDSMLVHATGVAVNHQIWSDAPYHPTPTVVEAARALYAGHSVQDIIRHDADAPNFDRTWLRIEELLDRARVERRKIICFVTGVPGAGKTLVGLNVATRRRDPSAPEYAVFLSGNDPLVKVLREALVRDQVVRKRAAGERETKKSARQSVESFIQNVHQFRDSSIDDERPPAEHIAIFDEAQRAWNASELDRFMRTKKKRSGFNISEPEYLISCMDRHLDWAAIVCLVGGGQEINRGEAGIDEWMEALQRRFPHWSVCISPLLTDTEYGAGRVVELAKQRRDTLFDDALHLAVSMRSFRTERVSTFVKALLDCDRLLARDAHAELVSKYPVAITRELPKAKQWLKEHARGSERYGLLASSSAFRLRPHAIDIRAPFDPVHWFLDDKEDVRSSYYLEDAATEFAVQGLELDWACVTWDGDLRFDGVAWTYFDFQGNRWKNVLAPERKRYLCNAYRVLLTRARQGMVLFIPPGDSEDSTRLPKYYDATYDYLKSLGIPSV